MRDKTDGWMKNVSRSKALITVVAAIACAIACWLPMPVHAQAYELRVLNEEAGLGEGYVYSIVQDNLGFLYVGTGSGIYRFDGAKFVLIDTTDGLVEDFTTAAFRDRHGRVWLGHYQGGVSFMDKMEVGSLRNNSIKSVVHSFAEDKAGLVWCASQRGVHLIDTTGVKASFTEGLEEKRAHSMAIGRVGGSEYCLVGTDQGLLVYRLSGRKLQLLYSSQRIPETKVTSIVKVPTRSGFWVGTEDGGLFEYVPASSDTSAIVKAFDDKAGMPELMSIQSLMIDSDRHLWVGTPTGLRKYRDRAGEMLVPIVPALRSDTLPQYNIRSLYQDNFGQVWAGTYGDGLVCLSEQELSTYRLAADSSTRTEIMAILEDRGGDFWIGTSRGLYRVDRVAIRDAGDRYTMSGLLKIASTRRFGMADGLPSEQISCILQDSRKNLWVGTSDHGVAMLPFGEEKFIPKQISELHLGNHINGLAQDRHGKVWAATAEGAYAIDQATGQVEFFGTQNKLPHNNIYQLFCDKAGKIWFLTHTNRIAAYDGNKIENIEVSHHGETPNITCMAQTQDGVYWLGSDGSGLYRYDGKAFHQFTKLDGLQSNYVYHLVVDHYNNVWATHRDGLSRLIQQTGRIMRYPTADNLPLEENPVNAATIDLQGNLWFASEYGALRFNWHPARNKTAAPYIFVDRVQVGDSTYEDVSEFHLPYGQHTLRFEFLGLTFMDQEDVLYQYRLNGGESNWSAPTKQDFVTLQDLPDGDYTFEVRACNVFGKCNESAAKIKFSIAPPFWKTWWFQLLCVLALAAVVVFYIRFREYRLKREKAILEEKVRRRTEELRAEKEKVELANIELERLSLVASETDNAVFILDPQGRVTWVNAGFSRLTGLSLEQLLRLRNVSDDFLATSSDPEAKERLRIATESRSSVQYESQLPTSSGEPLWVLSTLTPIYDKNGALRNIVIIDSNITERRKAEEKVQQMNAELERLVEERTRELAEANHSLQVENGEHVKTSERLRVINAELDTFVYRASHDLKGPLASLMGLINIANMELSEDPTAQRYLGLMGKASKRLDGILIDLIEAVQVKQRSVELADVSAAELAQSVVETVQQQADMTGAEIQVDVPRGLRLCTDETLLRSILQNFLINALKYRDTKKEKAIAKLHIGVEGHHWVFSVTDNGLGIPAEAQHRVFDMFYRGAVQSTGSGLGLYIVKQAAEKLGGTVALQSELGEGSTFTASIPVTSIPVHVGEVSAAANPA